MTVMVGNLKLSASSQCIKYLMFSFNLIFVITGIILISIGSVIHGIYYNYKDFLDDRYLSVPSLLIAVGSIIFFIAFFGCCGAIKENFCMMVTFAALMVLVFIMELSAGISGYVLRSEAEQVLTDKMKTSMQIYNKTTNVIWDNLQQKFTCCGTLGPSDWNTILEHEETSIKNLPVSCCPFRPGSIGKLECTENSDDLYKTGCAKAVGDFIQGHALQLGSAGIGIAVLQALGIWFSIYLARAIRKTYSNM